MKKYADPKTGRIEFSNLGDTPLSNLLDDLKDSGVSSRDFDKVQIEQDYRDCWYEGDAVGVRAVYIPKQKKKRK